MWKKIRQKSTLQAVKRLVKRSVIFFGCAFGLFLLGNLLFPLPDRVDYSTIITDSRGEVIHAFLTPDDKWRLKTDLQEISPLLRATIIAKEDRHFYRHPGINPLAAVRALWNNLLTGRRTSGASTITMQVARALEPRPRTLWAKAAETFRAFQLEWRYSKEEILQLYLNLVPYGGNIEGVKSASLLYFGKSPDHLSLAQITALCIIPNRPSTLVIGRHNDRIVQERNRWLHRFAAENVFTRKEIEDALAEPLEARRGVMPRYIPHLARKLKRDSRNGEPVRTFIRMNTQLKVEKLVADAVRSLKLQGIRNASVVILDNATQAVITYVGSGDFYDTSDGGQVNGAAAIRQPGSTLKPLLYGLSIDEGLVTPATVLHDVPVAYSGYAPENYDRSFQGPVTVEYALDHSLNVPAVRCLQQLGKDRLINRLEEAGFRQIRRDRGKLGLSLILGGCGSTLEELTGLFAAFAHEGQYRPLRFTDGTALPAPKRILSAPAAFMIHEMLSKVNRPDFPLNWGATERMPKIAWKTGTSYGRRDAWSIGYNRRYTVGVWAGNFLGQGAPELSGANTATPLLFKIFNTIDYDSEGDWFTPPEGIGQRQVCPETGRVPGLLCTGRVLDYFLPLYSSTQPCAHLEEIRVAPDERLSYCSQCAPETGYKRKAFRVLPPDLQAFYTASGTALEAVPPHNPACEKIFKGEGPKITAPRDGSEYYLSARNPEPLQLAAAVSGDVGRLHWYINDRYYKSAAAGEKLFFLPEEGPVKISCTDDKGRNRDIRIQVRRVSL